VGAARHQRCWRSTSENRPVCAYWYSRCTQPSTSSALSALTHTLGRKHCDDRSRSFGVAHLIGGVAYGLSVLPLPTRRVHPGMHAALRSPAKSSKLLLDCEATRKEKETGCKFTSWKKIFN
jgi:hypothetical protein